MDNVFVDQDAIVRSISHVPPTHYVIKIQSYSLLVEKGEEKYESAEFEAGGNKWKLVIYPRGNKRENVKDHISFYLAIANPTSLGFGWEIHASFRLFLLDQKKEKLLILQDAMGSERSFHWQKLERGFDQFISLEAFNNAANGYLVEDTCVFGAEVFVKERKLFQGECLSMIETTYSSKHVWKIEKFSELEAKELQSQVFSAGGYNWKILLYPKGNQSAIYTYLSMFLELADSTTLSPASKIFVDFTLRILDQKQFNHKSNATKHWFSVSSGNWGWPRFISLNDLKDPGKGFLVNDVCVVEAEVTVLGISKSL